MRRFRRLTCLFAALALALAPAPALAQSAGDEQYQDPFGSETTQSEQGGSAPTEEPTLTDEPQVTPDITQPPPVSSTLGDVPRTSQQGAPLADTGIDTRLFLALGASLLLAGLGLRLRTIPERF